MGQSRLHSSFVDFGVKAAGSKWIGQPGAGFVYDMQMGTGGLPPASRLGEKRSSLIVGSSSSSLCAASTPHPQRKGSASAAKGRPTHSVQIARQRQEMPCT